MKKALFLLLAIMACIATQAQDYRFNGNPNGFSISNSDRSHLTIKHNIGAVSIESSDRDGAEGQFITLSGIHIANKAGAPNLPSSSTFVAIPNGAKASIKMVGSQTKTIGNVDLFPAPKPQLDDDDSPAVYEKDMNIYSRNAFYPSTPYQISDVMTVRGVEMVEVGVMPFQYNPVTKELVVYSNMELQIEVEGGDGTYGDLRYRTPEWDQILEDIILNRDVLPEVDYGERLRKHYENRETGCEYIIITPDDEEFVQLADSIKQFRTEQGIPTEVYIVSQCGGNDHTAIKNFIQNAYYTWDMPPAAVLFLGDHNTDETKGIVSHPMYNHPSENYNPYISDHAYAVMDNSHMPEIIVGRITGRTYDEMYHMIKKDLDYERRPPTNPDFYDHPVTAMGFQLERWFQLCSEIVYGFLESELGKHPVRQNAIYQGIPGSLWSTYEYTNSILDYFGPNGCNYIPQTMSHLTDWSATGTSVNEAINSGAFLIQHRDHGAEELWGEPSYGIGYIKRLTNKDLTYVMSNNCLTGRFNYGGTNGEGCFAEVFHRHQYGALGLIAATQVSYSYVNDIYVWGVYDNMWPDFMPTYGAEHSTNFVRPAFGNAAGKYFLRQSSWTDDYVKEITYYLFHQHGDAYMNLYTEVPQPLNVEMLPVITAGSNQYTIKADEGANISLTANGQIIGYGLATGDTQTIEVVPQEAGTIVKLTITKQNCYRYSHNIQTIPAEGPYMIFDAIEINDAEGNGNQSPDYDETCQLGISLHNVGHALMEGFTVTLSCDHPSVEIMQNTFAYNDINANETQMQANAFIVHFDEALNDQDKVKFHLRMENQDYTFFDSITLTVKAPNLKCAGLIITDQEGNETDRLMKGQSSYITFLIDNEGASKSKEVSNTLTLLSPYLSIEENEISIPAIDAFTEGQVTFLAHAAEDAVEGLIKYKLQAKSGCHTETKESDIPLGYTSEDFEDETLNEDVQWMLGSGSKAWHIVEDTTALGGHCLRSPNINSGSASLYISIITEAEGKISFLYKTTAQGNTNLQFQLSGNPIMEWSGDNEWDRYEYDLSEGKNLIRFIFKKDASNGGDDDAAFLDHILLPCLPKMVIYAGEDAEICSNDSFIPEAYIYNQSSFEWSTSGDGSFDDATLEHPIYTFGESDKATGQVELTLTGVSSLNESQQSSTTTVSIIPAFDSGFSPAAPTGETNIDLRLDTQSDYTTEEIENVLYTWSIEPPTAGSITGEGHQAHVEWDSEYRGEASISYYYENTCGATNTSEFLKVNVFNSTGIDEQQNSTIEVYPNPARGYINVKTHLEGAATLRIIDMLGRVVYECRMENEEFRIETSKIGNEGIYMLQVIQNDIETNTRVVVTP